MLRRSACGQSYDGHIADRPRGHLRLTGLAEIEQVFFDKDIVGTTPRPRRVFYLLVKRGVFGTIAQGCARRSAIEPSSSHEGKATSALLRKEAVATVATFITAPDTTSAASCAWLDVLRPICSP